MQKLYMLTTNSPDRIGVDPEDGQVKRAKDIDLLEPVFEDVKDAYDYIKMLQKIGVNTRDIEIARG